MRHPDAHGGLAALVLVDAQQARHFVHVGLGKAVGHDVCRVLVVLHVALDDGIQHLVLGQAVLVLLVGAQLGTGRTGDDALGDGVAAGAIRVVGIAPPRQPEHHGLDHILDDGKAARHVAVQRAVAGGHFALVARGQHDAAEFVAQRHQQRAPDAGLQVFFGGVFGQPGKVEGKAGLEGFKVGGNVDFVVAHAKALSHVAGIDP